MKKLLLILTVPFLFIGCGIQNYSQLEVATDATFQVIKNTKKPVKRLPDYRKLAATTYNTEGFNDLGIHKETGTEYNPKGFSRGGYNKEGIHWKELGIPNPMVIPTS